MSGSRPLSGELASRIRVAVRTLEAAAAAATLAAAVCLAGCGPVPDPRAGYGRDLQPPGIEGVRAVGPRELEVSFSEEACVEASTLRIDPALSVLGVSPASQVVTIAVAEQSPGREYRLEATASDARGNATTFLASFRGFNPRVPRIVVNELTPRGSTAHPDLVELKVLTDGEMGGVVFYVGTPSSFDQRLIFPSFPVNAGAFIVVHCRPLGDPGEIDEVSDPSASSGIDAVPTARDFWLPDGKGLGGNNGAITVYDRPGGKILDGLLYSNRTSSSDSEWRGFGSAETLLRAEELARDGGWLAAGAKVAPEDAVSPEGSTATRSICRSSTSEDTDSKADWHIAPTRGASFGAENSDEFYSP